MIIFGRKSWEILKSHKTRSSRDNKESTRLSWQLLQDSHARGTNFSPIEKVDVGFCAEWFDDVEKIQSLVR